MRWSCLSLPEMLVVIHFDQHDYMCYRQSALTAIPSVLASKMLKGIWVDTGWTFCLCRPKRSTTRVSWSKLASHPTQRCVPGPRWRVIGTGMSVVHRIDMV